MFCSGDSEKQKNKFKTIPNSCLSKHWCKIENKEDVWDSLHPFGVQLKTILQVTVLLISKKYRLFISIQHLAKPGEVEAAVGKTTLIIPRFWDMMLHH
jgi:hypothetical protein